MQVQDSGLTKMCTLHTCVAITPSWILNNIYFASHKLDSINAMFSWLAFGVFYLFYYLSLDR